MKYILICFEEFCSFVFMTVFHYFLIQSPITCMQLQNIQGAFSHRKSLFVNENVVRKTPIGGWFMMTSSNGNIFCVTGPLCGEFTGHRWITCTKASDAELDVFFDLRLNKKFSKQSCGWLFETLLRPLWRHCNVKGWMNGTINTDRWSHSIWVISDQI